MYEAIKSYRRLNNLIIILLVCLPFVFLIPQKADENYSSRKLSKRNLKSTNICSKTSSEFSQYYRLGDRSILNMDEDNTEDYDSYYIEALINIVKNYYEKKRDNESDSEFKKNLFKYAYHILPLIIVLCLGILSLVAWIVWGVCVCQKCKCCYCKRQKCKTPSIVLALIFYIIVALICLYSLVEQNKVFEGLADLECSVLKFTDEVLQGEKVAYPPFWTGIDNIETTLQQISSKINELKDTTITNLQNLQSDVNNKKETFENSLKDAGNRIKNNYIKTYDSNNYQLDLAKLFGTYDTINKEASPEKSVCNFWITEYSSLASKAKTEMTNTIESFSTILNGVEITQSLTIAQTRLSEIKTEFKALENLFSDYIFNHADDVDKKGKVIYALFFSILIILCAAIIVFMLLLCCCSGKVCTNLTCLQYFFKYFLHIFWNIMALIMFLLFMGGSWFTIAGTLGGDLVNVISFLISNDNLGDNKDTIILGNVKQYLNKCFNDEGNILNELGFHSNMNYFENLKKSLIQIEEIKNQFNDKLNKFVYTEYLEELTERAQFNSPEFELVSVDDGITPNSYNFVDLLNGINSYSDSNNLKEKWDITSTLTNKCSASNPDDSGHSNTIIYHPKYCYPTIKPWVNSEASLNDKKTKLNDMKDLIETANKESDPYSIKSLLNGLNTDYSSFLESEITSLGTFIDNIKKITDIVKNYTSEDDELFSFMNCNYLKPDVQVILFYLKNSIGNDLYEVGVYLLIAAFSMPFAISFTILLIVITNEEVEKNKEELIKDEKSKQNKSKDVKKSAVRIDNISEREIINDKINDENNSKNEVNTNNGIIINKYNKNSEKDFKKENII